MKKAVILLACFTLLGFTKNVNAQMGMGKPDDIQEIKKRKLIVILEEPNEDVMKRLTKKHKTDEINSYQTALKLYNDQMKEVVEKFWNFSGNEIEYKTSKDAEKITNKEAYALIYCSSGANGVGSKHEALAWYPAGEDKLDAAGVTFFAVCLLENRKPVYYLGMPDVFPTKADLVYGITATEFYFNYRLAHQRVSKSEYEEMVEEYQPRLKHRTLLLRQDQMDEKIKPEEIKAAYPFAYRTVATDELDQYVVNADSAYAYGVIAPFFGGREVIYVQYVYDCKDGTMLGMSMPSMGAMMFSGYTGKAGKSEFTKKTLADLCKYITDDPKKKKK